MDYKNLMLMLFVPLISGACASNQMKASEIEEMFVTDIKSNGIKLFNYTVTTSDGPHRVSGRSNSGGEVGMSGVEPADWHGRESGMKEKMHEKLDARLTETGYCREGYIVLSSSIGGGRSFIRGECKEGATEDDRKRFANSQ
ncbi:MAG: hypothetical protein WBP44_05640 [Gammaproteobacteria bacterium]